MLRKPREYTLSADQPILKRSRRRRKRAADSERMEASFWRTFDLEKLSRDWRRALRQPAAAR